MGRLEKIVVLTVLFLVAVILGVSLNQGTGESDPMDPGTLARGSGPPPAGEARGLGAAEEGLDQPESANEGAASQPLGASGLLSATTSDGRGAASVAAPILPDEEGPGEAPPAAEPPAPAPRDPAVGANAGGDPARYLLTEEGLQPSRVPQLRLYAWREGDSFTAVADRYYGSRLQVGRLRKANEGRDESTLRPGDEIFVPAVPPAPADDLRGSSEIAGEWLGGVYVVQSGDILGKIAQKVYGQASRWRAIYDANRDVLGSPDDLQVGMRLRIPELR